MNAEQRAALRQLDRQFDAIRAMPDPIPARERYRHTIEDVVVGAYLRVGREIHRIESANLYREKGSQWTELELLGLESGETVWVEWEKDDEVEVSVSGRELSLSDLGVSSDQVEEMSEAESGRISFEGKSFHYDDDYGAQFHRDGGDASEPVYFYDFETPDERFCLSVEEWGSAADGYEYVAFVSEYIEPDTIEIVALPAAGS